MTATHLTYAQVRDLIRERLTPEAQSVWDGTVGDVLKDFIVEAQEAADPAAGVEAAAREFEEWAQPYSEQNALRSLVEDWARERSTASSVRQHQREAHHARRVGLPVLAGLLEFYGRLEHAAGPLAPSEVMAEVALLVALARGEGQVRLERKAEGATIPGMHQRPNAVL